MARRLMFTWLFLFSVLVMSSALGQETTDEAIVSEERAALPEDVGYLGINIGMSRTQVLEAAESNDMITVPKNRDVDFFPIEEREILTLSVKPEIPFIYLQFFDDVLYAITVIFDESYMDYYTLCNSLSERYGEYTSLTPQWRQWRLDRVTVKAEKPAVVKYIALHDFLEAASFEGKVPEFDMEKREALLEGL